MEAARAVTPPLECRRIGDPDFQRFAEIDAEYLGSGLDRLEGWRAERPGWFRGAFLGEELVGVCHGHRGDGEEDATLQGIAVLFEHWRRGIGSALIQDFERAVATDGVRRVSLGSATDAPTEGFYLKNGYRPTRIMLWVSKHAASRSTAAPHLRVVERREDEGRDRLYFEVDAYVPELREAVRAEYGADEANFIFTKTVGVVG